MIRSRRVLTLSYAESMLCERLNVKVRSRYTNQYKLVISRYIVRLEGDIYNQIKRRLRVVTESAEW
jgi:hypothetical protein